MQKRARNWRVSVVAKFALPTLVFSVTLSGLSLSAGYFVAGCEGSNELVARVVAVEAILSNRSPGGRQPV